MMAGQLCLSRPVDLRGLRVCKSPLARRVRSQRRGLGVSCAVSTPAQNSENVKYAGVSWGSDLYSVETANACQEWLSREGLPPPKVAVKKVDTGGRGMVAARKIRRGELVISVPSSAIITVNSRWSSPEIGKIMKQEEVPEWPMLATYLVSEASLGRASRWTHYIDSLPQQPSSILQWSLADVNKYLSASCTRIRAKECISDVTDVFESLRAKIFSKHPELFPPQVFQLDTFIWAFGILFSRAVRLPTLGQVALVPLADMFNHSTEAKTFLDFNPSSVSVQLAAGQDYDEGQQVFNSYGKRSSSELLIAYGFVPSEVNDEDAVELSLELDPQDEMYEAKLNALKENSLATPQRYPVRKDGLATQMLAYARLVVSPAELEPTFKQMAFAATDKASAKQDSLYLSQLSLATDIQAHEHLLATCEAAISSYTAFLKGKEKLADNIIDESIATSESPKERAQWLMQSAVLLCINERRILYRLQTVLRSRLRELRAAVSGGADPDSPVKASSPGLLGGIKSLLGR